MKCDFCGREVPTGTVECPYCHYQFKIDAKVLSPDERDTFDGITIDENGSTEDTTSVKRTADGYSYEEYREEQQQNPGVKVHTFGCGSGLLMTLLILGGILALFFFLLPTFIVFAAIGAAVVFLMRLFM